MTLLTSAEAGLTADRVRALLVYDPGSGEFRWRARPVRPDHARTDRTWNKRFAGSVAGSINSCGYRMIRIPPRQWLAHRLAFLHQIGKWPANQIDHIDLARDNNRLCNLREATNAQNVVNSPAPRTNTSGFKGVSWSKQSRKWRAMITVTGRKHRLGLYEDPGKAHAAYAAAAKQHFGEFARFE
jgi:hypothetical protein